MLNMNITYFLSQGIQTIESVQDLSKKSPRSINEQVTGMCNVSFTLQPFQSNDG